MDTMRLERVREFEWRIPATGPMRVPGVIFASEQLLREMDDNVAHQVRNVASLPGIVGASYAMPDAHWGYGFPIGGVAAFDPAEGGVVSAGGVGFDISCGVRTLHTGLTRGDLQRVKAPLAQALYGAVPAGVGSTGTIHLSAHEMDAMLAGGAAWAVSRGWGRREDLPHIEEHGSMAGALPEAVSEQARKRQRNEMGTLGSGNHYLEVQEVEAVLDRDLAAAFGLHQGDVVMSIHCGSRGLGHQVATDYQRRMVNEAAREGRALPDRELAWAPIESELGTAYLGAMGAAINCALANRQIITALARDAFDAVIPGAQLSLLYDVSHNTCKRETHRVDGRERELYVHRKGATRAWGAGREGLPEGLKAVGQPVLIGGTMGTHSYILAGNSQDEGEGEAHGFSSACHGAGRAMSRRQATRTWNGRDVVKELETRGVLVRSPSLKGIAEEAPGAYKDVSAVVDATQRAGLARAVARLRPVVCIKG